MSSHFESPITKVIGVIISLSMWTAAYKFLRHSDKSHLPEWHCRMVAMLHALVISALSIYSQFIEGPSVFTVEPGIANTHLQIVLAKLCLGYFIFDLTWCLYHQTEPLIMLLHHTLSIFGMVCSLFYGIWGCELVGVMCATEITNPLLQIRWFLREMHKHSTWIAKLVDASFILTFGFLRIIVSGWVLYIYSSHPKPNFLGRLGGFSMYGINWIFWFYITKYAYRKYIVRLFTKQTTLTYKNGVAINNGTTKHKIN